MHKNFQHIAGFCLVVFSVASHFIVVNCHIAFTGTGSLIVFITCFNCSKESEKVFIDLNVYGAMYR